MHRIVILLILCLGLLGLPASTQAQEGEVGEPTPTAPIPKLHRVQAGETLTSIALLYGVTVDDLIRVNNLTNPEFLYEGQELLIPGQVGDVTTTVYTVQMGDTLDSIAAAFQTTPQEIVSQNNLLNPRLIYGGQQLVIISRTGSEQPNALTGTFHLVQPGETLALLALRYRVGLEELAAANHLTLPAILFRGQRLLIPGEQPYQPLSDEWVRLSVRPDRAIQGQTIAIYVENLLDGQPSGSFAGQRLRFTPYNDGYVALVGLPVDAPTGLQQLEITGSGSRPWQPFRQTMLVVPGLFGRLDLTLGVDVAPLLAPQVRLEDDALLAPYFERFSPTPLWQGAFQYPLADTVVTSNFGEFRTYNGSTPILHTGVDFFAAEGTGVFAAAAGQIIFNQPTPLRGNVIIIDHGLGVTTGYFHLSESLVSIGQNIAQRELIGRVGSTGLSTGAHLHWDLRVHNVPVSGQQWVEQAFP